MASTFSPNLNLELPGSGDYVDTWNVPVNADWTLLDLVFGGNTTVSLSNVNVNLTLTQQQNRVILLTGTLTGNVVVNFLASRGGSWIVNNATTGAFTVTLASAGGGSTTTVAQGFSIEVWSNGATLVDATKGSFSSGGTITGDLMVSGTIKAGTTHQVSITHDGSNASWANTFGQSIFFAQNGFSWFYGASKIATLDSSSNFVVGDLTLSGIGPVNSIGAVGFACRSGTGGPYAGNVFNITWDGSNAHLWIDGSNVGTITLT